MLVSILILVVIDSEVTKDAREHVGIFKELALGNHYQKEYGLWGEEKYDPTRGFLYHTSCYLYPTKRSSRWDEKVLGASPGQQSLEPTEKRHEAPPPPK